MSSNLANGIRWAPWPAVALQLASNLVAISAIVLFRQKQTSDRALTTDVTGRNLPSSTPYGPWVLVEILNTENAKPPLGLADFKEALS